MPYKSYFTKLKQNIDKDLLGKRVLVGGCFDILHYGHMLFLKKAKSLGDFLIIALEPDINIKKNKKRNPVHTAKQRAYILKQLRLVDFVTILPPFTGYNDYLQLVKVVRPSIIAITDNDPQKANKKKQAESVGAKIIVAVKNIKKFSTTSILNS